MDRIWSNFPLVRVLFAFVLGVIIAIQIQGKIAPEWVFLIFAGYLIYISTLFFFRKKFYRIDFFSGAFVFTLFVGLGIFRGYINDPTRLPTHYTSHENALGWQGTITKPAIEKENYWLHEAEIDHFFYENESKPATGKINFYVKKDSVSSKHAYGDVLQVDGLPFPIPSPKNPAEFNYAGYMQLQHIYQQQFVQPHQYRKLGNRPKYKIIAVGYHIRDYLRGHIDRFVEGSQEKAVLYALLLGIKDHLDREISGAYAAAGAMHVLAVSGLHVGIIYFVLLFLLSPLSKIKYGKWLKLAIFLTGLWFYAMVTGFSPSVLRAVTMFSLVILADTVARKSNIYNTIALSALLLLLFEPYLIFAVGFQLSYAAVIGIIYLQPRIYNLWYPASKVANWAWEITAVSLAAQIATFPLGLYYFHQFPTYFIFSNLIVIPAVAIILYSGLGFLLLASIHELPGEWMGWLLDWELYLMNQSVVLVEKLPGSLISWAHIDQVQLGLLMGMIFLLILLFHSQNLRWLYVLFCVALLWSFQFVEKTEQRLAENKIVHYAVRNSFAIDLIAHGQAILIADSAFTHSDLPRFQIDPSRLAGGFQPTLTLPEVPPYFYEKVADGLEIWLWKGEKIARISNKTAANSLESINCTQLIISNNAVTDSTSLANLKANWWIFDGSNRPTYALRRLVEQNDNAILLSTNGALEIAIYEKNVLQN